MSMRLLIVTPDEESLHLMHSLIEAALALIPLDVTVESVGTRAELEERVVQDVDDVIFLDWPVAEAGTPDLVREVLDQNPRLRVVALLPLHLRQYRLSTWCAGACNSVPKEYMDQEWLSSLLCLMWRAMERERRILTAAPNGGSVHV